MIQLDANELIFEVVKAGVLAAIGGVAKIYADLRSLRTDLDAAFSKIRSLECQSKDPPTSP